ncbi:MAG: SDR family NAD(P)-dependent oxidoreductase [Verrucomicrobiota bacterium]|jgi:NAD(P)-dependent dehydrogenase (short-subunit alcohol dehydrogenase family)
MNDLDIVVISGAGQGIGKAVALELGRCGVYVLCISRTKNCQATAAEIATAGGKAEAMILNIGQVERTKALLSAWIGPKSYKRIGLVLAAGILGPHNFGDLVGWEECYRVNVLGNVAVYSGLLPKMLGNNFGRIVGFAGGGAAYAYPLFPAYAASKAAMVRTIENIQADLNDKGDFAAICLAPGANETQMLQEIRAAGAEVKTIVNIGEPVRFVREFLFCRDCGFKGAFVHVRDNWRDYLNNGRKIGDEVWKLRRIGL